jgi:hypothetical protein
MKNSRIKEENEEETTFPLPNNNDNLLEEETEETEENEIPRKLNSVPLYDVGGKEEKQKKQEEKQKEKEIQNQNQNQKHQLERSSSQTYFKAIKGKPLNANISRILNSVPLYDVGGNEEKEKDDEEKQEEKEEKQEETQKEKENQNQNQKHQLERSSSQPYFKAIKGKPLNANISRILNSVPLYDVGGNEEKEKSAEGSKLSKSEINEEFNDIS